MTKELKKGQMVYDKLNGKKVVIHQVIDGGKEYKCRYWDEQDHQYSFVDLYPEEISIKQTVKQQLGFKS